MKTLMAMLLAAALFAPSAHGQYSSAKRQARELQEKINQRHASAEDGAPPPNLPGKPGLAKPAAPSAPTPAPAAAAAPIKPSSQQQAATKLKADIAEAGAKGAASPELKKQFVTNLGLAALGRNQPSTAALERFGEGLISSLAGRKLNPPESEKLVKAIVVCLNSAGLSTARLQELNDEVRGLLTKNGVPEADVNLAGQNLSAVVADIQSSAGK